MHALLQFAELLAAIRVVHHHILQPAARPAAMDELVLQHQSRSADDLALARVLDDGHIVVAALLHLGKTACGPKGEQIIRGQYDSKLLHINNKIARTKKLRPTHGPNRRQLAEQLEKAAIVVALLERSHQQPWLARVGGRDGGPEGGRALCKVQPLEQRRIVEGLFALCMEMTGPFLLLLC